MAARGETRSARVQRLLQEAAALRADGRLADAERRYRSAVRLSPDNLSALYHLGTLLAAMHRPAESARFLERALATKPAAPEVQAALREALAALESGRR
ncbi:MAG: tetratricopeptide repeat protein [Betaproteobacteria bacterium]|nr:tetratricopeptide repeat protein [Betaproteobacteria bacterium]